MNKQVLLGAAISLAALQVSAVPFAPTDARAMAMGGTGVASSKTVHAVQFNPSLLSSADESDDFGLLFPQVGGYFSDEDEFIDSADQFIEDDYATAFEDSVNDIEAGVSTATDAFSDVDAAITAQNSAVLVTANQTLANGVTALKVGTDALEVATENLNNGLRTLSEKALRGGLGFGAGIAIPSKKFSVAVSANNSTTFSGLLRISETDLSTLSNYATATSEYASVLTGYSDASAAATITLAAIDTESNKAIPDPNVLIALGDQLDADQQALSDANDALAGFNYGGSSTAAEDGDQIIFQGGELAPGTDSITLDSEAHIIAVAITEVALSISREFQISGKPVAIGLSPKFQRIDVYDYVVNVESEVDVDDIDELGVDDTGFNLDIGASMEFGKIDQGKAGLVIKNIISKEVTSVGGQIVEITPQIRAGVGYQAFGWINLAADLDLMENDPVAFEDPSQFLALGAEFDVFGFLQLRGGYRTNLASTGQDVISGGFGLSPFSLFHLDLGLYTNTSAPEKEAGAVFELGVDW